MLRASCRRWWVIGLCVVVAAVAQEEPGGNMANPENALGPTKVQAKRRAVLALPLVNASGKSTLDFWRYPLSVLVAAQFGRKSVLCETVGAPKLIDAFAAGKVNPEKPEERFACLRACGGDTVLTTSFKVADEQWTLTGTAYDATDPKFAALKTITASGPSPYTALVAYVEAWSPELGGTASAKKDDPATTAGGGTPAPAPTPAPTPTPAPGPAPGGGSPGSGAPKSSAPGGETPGAPGTGTPAATALDLTPAAPPAEDYNLEHWARGLAAWPYRDPKQAYRGDIDGALRSYERQLRIEPRFAAAYVDAALAYVAAGEADRGVQIQKMWTDAQQPNAADLHNLALVYHAAGRTDEALLTYAKALTAPDGPWPVDAIGAAQALYDAGRYADVVKGIRAFPAICSQLRDLHLLLGKAFVALGDTKSAVEPLQTARAMAPFSLDGYVALCDVYAKRRFWRGCLDVATEAMRANGDDPEASVLLVKYQILTGKAQAAAAVAGRAAARWPDHAGVQTALGEAQMAIGKPAQAAEAFRAAVAADPFDGRCRRMQARCQLQAGDGDGAARLVDVALRCAAPRDMAETGREGARIHFHRGDYAKCEAMLALADEYEPGTAEATMMRSFIRLYQNDAPGAWALFCRALELDKSGSASTEAMTVFNKAAADPKKPVALVLLGVLEERAGRPVEARGNYRKYRLVESKGFLAKFVEDRLEATKGKVK